jgi:hypothetical protein
MYPVTKTPLEQMLKMIALRFDAHWKTSFYQAAKVQKIATNNEESPVL